MILQFARSVNLLPGIHWRMGRSGEATQARILAAAYRQFYRLGYARVTMEAVAEAAGVTKRTVYQHVESKDALLAAVLERQQDLAMALVRGWGAERAASERELVEAVFSGLERWAARPRWLGSGYTRLAMELADLPGHPARAIAGKHKRSVEAWLEGEFARLGTAAPAARAREVVLLIEGAICLVLIHGAAARAAGAGADVRSGWGRGGLRAIPPRA
jgi:AcrR family transcriptional regulator